MISLIVAMSRNRVIGQNGRLPWRLPNDMKRFRQLTWGKPVIMGRKTYESIPDRFRPLPGRQNIVLSRNPAYTAPGAAVVPSPQAALAAARGPEVSEIMIGGGETIYRLFLLQAERIYLTRVETTLAGDAYFPPLDETAWQEIKRDPHPADPDHPYPYTFLILERTK
jgi:dihydrofolate reductase